MHTTNCTVQKRYPGMYLYFAKKPKDCVGATTASKKRTNSNTAVSNTSGLAFLRYYATLDLHCQGTEFELRP
jgi:hypothetical protein